MESNKINGVCITYEYNKFKFFNWNREIKENRILLFMKDITKYGWIPSEHILCNSNFEIFDGQHRFHALKRLGLPIKYVIDDNLNEEIVKRLNSTQFRWTLHDYVHSNAINGVKHYDLILKYINELKIDVSGALALVPATRLEPHIIKNGKRFEQFLLLDELVDFILYCKPLVYYWSSAPFINASKRLIKNADSDQLKRIKNNIVSLPKQVGATEYLTAFENIANRHKKTNFLVLPKQK